ncbi:hypothetical protein [Pseudoalteromonas denitrificans]|uniref:Uncharacterized protein n=1 Tax=Pseudoalteromonas denitrificans DSM 6059 TaxID=1123010 RepID=A0A1I1Q4M9_9GAMM|nr:hypothetical protein [Pseudoalteromonas denitrificans]SFD17081.1 hypothetical protein SAMN02745724_03739 [Pseudoalteromonas denitrificans DSM 6059]
MNSLIPHFEIQGTANYPDNYQLFTQMEKVNFNNKDYWFCHYAGDKQLTEVSELNAYLTWLQIQPKQTGIRIITIGSMKRRFTTEEEVLIVDSTDTMAKVIRERLSSSRYADLDFLELTRGVSYLVNFLVNTGAVKYEFKDRLEELLQDGTSKERYTGLL